MKKITFCLSLLLGAGCWSASLAQQKTALPEADYTQAVAAIGPLDMKRVSEISALLPDKPAGFGLPYTNRAAWDKLRESGQYAGLLQKAANMLQQDFPAWDNDTYMGMFTKGDSQSGKVILHNRLNWLVVLCWAECLENKGRFVPTLEKVIQELITQKTWVYPRNYSEESYGGLVELSTSSYAHNLAQALYLLDDKLRPQTRSALVAALYKRAFNPVLATLEGKNNYHSWLKSTNNWNAVCLSGITGAALTAIPDKGERAKFVALAEKYIQNFLAGFHNDGYCTEGIGYYNYGFGRFITLRENIHQATQGRIDLFGHPKINKIASFLPNMEILPDTYPAIADCPINARPGKNIMYYTSRNLGMGLAQYDQLSLLGAASDLVADVMYVFPNTASQSLPRKKGQEPGAALRSYFDVAGILTVRPAPGSSGNLGAVLKGGKNNEHHNHNDLGSYTIAVGKEVLMGDPGIIPYTAKTFGPERYSYKTIDSYGHPVPFIARQEQRPGAEAQAKITLTQFSPERDRFEMDITSAYAVAGLRSMIRKFDYQRKGQVRLEVHDEFAFAAPQVFETALITRAKWKQVAANQVLLSGEKGKLLATIQAPKGGFTILAEEIIEEKSIPYTRLGIRLNQPLAAGTVTVTYTEIK